MGFLENHCWHLWFLIASKWKEVIFADDTATEASGNEVGKVVSEVFSKGFREVELLSSIQQGKHSQTCALNKDVQPIQIKLMGINS